MTLMKTAVAPKQGKISLNTNVNILFDFKLCFFSYLLSLFSKSMDFKSIGLEGFVFITSKNGGSIMIRKGQEKVIIFNIYWSYWCLNKTF